MSLFSLKNKSILITGSSKGIGKSIAHQSALMGANVIISSRKIDACEDAAAKQVSAFGVPGSEIKILTDKSDSFLSFRSFARYSSADLVMLIISFIIFICG